MERFLNIIKAHAESLDSATGQPRFGIVTSVDTNSGCARVTLQPEGVLSGWLPILSPWAGAGWGLVCPPSPGDQVMVLAQEGDAEQGVIVGAAFSTAQLPPAAPVGEFWLLHSSGSSIKLQNDGTIRMNGNLYVNGDVYDSHGPLSALRMHYDGHTHIDSRGGTTSISNEQD
jgi:phage baseplate assembly protein gpV